MVKRNRQVYFIILAAVLSVFMLTATAFAAISVPKHTDSFYVNDFANVLSPQTEQHIMQQSRAYDESNGTQVVVATVPNLGGVAIEDYALEMARSWKIGGAEENNGLLILVAVEDRELRVEIGYGLEGVINDAKAGRYIRNEANPLLSNNKWDEGILALYNALLGELENPTPMEEEDEESSTYFLGIMIALIIIISILASSTRRGGPPDNFGGGGGGGGHYRGFRGGYYGGFGGGGFSGGGGGFGGGGGGFSGGGGGFGGGGASGKF
ncbi:MAG: TPM domain-containing protein [Angelakisella sp.]